MADITQTEGNSDAFNLYVQAVQGGATDAASAAELLGISEADATQYLADTGYSLDPNSESVALVNNYADVFGRTPDESGFNFYVNDGTDMTSDQIAGLFQGSSEYQTNQNTAAIDGVNDAVSGLSTGIETANSGITTANSGITNANDTLNNISNTVNAIDYSGDFAALGGQVGDVKTAVDDGFATSAANQQTIINQTDTLEKGQESLAGGIATVEGKVNTANTGITTANDNLTKLANAVSTGFTDAQSSREAIRDLVLTGQTSLDKLVRDYGDKGLEFFASLVSGQDTLTKGQSDIQSSVGDFRNTYEDNFANQSRFLGDMQSQLEEGFVATREGQRALDTSFGTSLSNAVAGGSTASDTTSGVQGIDAEAPFSDIAKAVSTGQASAGTGAQAQWVSSLNNMRQLLRAEDEGGTGLPIETLRDMAFIESSFDQAGKLIPRVRYDNGVVEARAIDANGVLGVSVFNAQGTRVAQRTADIDRVMSMVDSRSSNGSMGLMTAPYQRTYG